MMKMIIASLLTILFLIGCGSKYEQAIQAIEERSLDAYSEDAIAQDEEPSLEEKN